MPFHHPQQKGQQGKKKKTPEKESYLAASHGSPKKSEILATRVPEPIEEPLHRVMSTARGVPLRLWVLDLDLL